MEKHQLSKSTFIRGAQCLKSLYLNKKRYFLRDKLSDEQRLKFKRGTKVGKIAQELFPGGSNLQPGHPSQYRKAVEKTTFEIEKGTGIIYEAGFQHNAVLVFLDVLLRNPDGSYHAVEVKSSKAISDTYLLDAALQYFVINGSGLNITKFSIAYIDTEYILGENLQLDNLFKLEDILEKIIPLQQFIEEQIEREKQVFKLKHSPDIDIGKHCNSPYPCDFRGHCWKNVPSPSVFNLNSLSVDEQFDLYYEGLANPEDLLKSGKKLSESARQELISIASGKIFAVPEKIRDFIGGVKEAVFIKISSIVPAIPYIKGMRPYEAVIYLVSFMGPDRQVRHFPVKDNVLSDNALKKIFNSKKLVIYGQRDLTEKMLIANNLENEGIIDISQVFNENIMIHPGLLGNFSPENVFKTIAGNNWNKDSIIKNELLASESYNNILENDTSEDFGNIELYNSNFLAALTKVVDYLQNYE